MNISINKKDVFWSYIAQLSNYGSGLILLPFILHLFSTKEIGLWYLFLNMTALAYIMDFGFMPNITRIVSYIYSGAQTISKEGLPTETSIDIINYNLLKSVISVVKKIYAIITVILIIILFVGGTFYLRGIISTGDNKLWVSFYLYSFSICLNFFYSYYDALLLGRGLIKAANQSISLSKFTYLIIAIAGIYFNFGLLSISVASIISVLLNRYLYVKRFYDTDTRQFLKSSLIEENSEIFSQIWHNAKKLGLAAMGAFCILQSNLLIAGKFFTLTEVATLGLTMQLCSTLSNFSRLYFITLVPRFNSLRISNNLADLKKEFIRSMKIGWVAYICGILFLCFAGNYLLQAFHAKTLLPHNSIFLLFGFVYIMEITHGNSATLITTKNTVPFVGASLFSGLGVIILNFLFILVFHLRIETFAISTIIIQLSYNAWKWPYEVIKDLRITLNDFYDRVL